MRNTSRTYFAYSLFALCVYIFDVMLLWSSLYCCSNQLIKWPLHDALCVCLRILFISSSWLSFPSSKHLSMWDNNILRFYEFIVFKLKFPCLSLFLLLLVVPISISKTCNVYRVQAEEARKNLKLKTWWPKKCCCHNIKGHNNIIHEHKRSGAKVSCHILCNTYKKR